MKGSQHEVVVESLANSGDGVGRIDGKVAFIPFSAPGDHLLVEVTLDKKYFIKAKIVKVIKPSANRSQPQCSYFGNCGGCDWQHIPYLEQIKWKKNNLLDVLQRIGGIDGSQFVTDTHPCSKAFGYRNRIQIHVDRKGPFFYSKGSKNQVHINKCPIASNAINRWIEKNASHLKDKKKKLELAESLDGTINTFLVNEVGQSEMGFRQVNTEQNQWISQQILKLIKTNQIQSVVDLFCGQGNWSLSIARQNESVQCFGIDSLPKNIEVARSMSLPNTHFVLGDVEKDISQWKEKAELIIIDPPRAGCSSETLQQLNQESCQWVVYISCHPATLARDLGKLVEQKWTIEKLIPVDMFPQTAHLECLTILRSAKGAKTANY